MSGTEAIRLVLPSAVNQATGLAFDLIVTERRLIGVWVGGLRWGYGLDYDGTLRHHQDQRQRYAGLGLDQIASAVPENFEIPLDMLEQVRVEPRDSRLLLPVVALRARGSEARFLLLSSTRHPADAWLHHALEVLPILIPGKVVLTR